MALQKNIYELVKKILTESETARNSDKALMWIVWREQNKTRNISNKEGIFWTDFKDALSPETITRARRKVCERYPNLKGNENIERARREKEGQKGLFIYDPLQDKSIRVD